MEPIDLKRIAKENGWRLTVEEGSQHSAKSSFVDPWMLQIPCKWGHFYPYSKKLIGVAVDSTRIAARLKRKGFVVRQEGSDGSNFVVTEEGLADIAITVHPYKKPKGNPRTAEQMAEARASRRRESLDEVALQDPQKSASATERLITPDSSETP